MLSRSRKNVIRISDAILTSKLPEGHHGLLVQFLNQTDILGKSVFACQEISSLIHERVTNCWVDRRSSINRNVPVNGSNIILEFDGGGNLVILDRSGSVVWSSNSSGRLSDPVARILDTGNLVLGESSSIDTGVYSWQSFDYPSDTLLAGMTLGWDLRRGFERHLTSWKSADDPAPGEYACMYKVDGLLQGKIVKGSVVKFRTGQWNGIQFSGISTNISFFRPFIVNNETDAYFEFGSLQDEVLSKVTMNASGLMQRSAS
ncbi:hypothetical protein MLD38_035230 [Melastoma candidum]|uniref:Uncharacterized protein n=1 Tax=Melastoma candidum TaxID=119954 RepID=A0ACB9MD07_9MYRT|nr:hypothetical protein MLD38_035230 [Melastoma candidum]